MSNNLHRNLLDLDDTSIDADESLLVSPASKTESADGAFDKTAEDAFNVGNDSFQNSPMNKADESILSIDSSINQTPSKPRFSYANAMDALEDIMPSAMKTKRSATMFSFEHSSAKKMSAAKERLSGGLNESFDYSTLGDNDPSFVAESVDVRPSDRLEKGADSLQASLGEKPTVEQNFQQSAGACDQLDKSLERSNSVNGLKNNTDQHLDNSIDAGCEDESPIVSETNNKDEHSVSFQQEASALAFNEEEFSRSSENEELESYNESPPTIGLDELENNHDLDSGTYEVEKPPSNRHEQSSAFRYPCIRQDDTNEKYLELKLGHPVNDSFDGIKPKRVGVNTSMNIQDDAGGTSLDNMDRMDPIDACIDEREPPSDESNEQSDNFTTASGGSTESKSVLKERPDSLDESVDHYDNIFESSTETNSFEHSQQETTFVDEAPDLDESSDVYAKAIRNLDSSSPDAEYETSPSLAIPAEYESRLHSSIDSQANHPAVHTELEEHTPPAWNALSPIAKSSSPHNCDDNLSESEKLVLEKKTISSAEAEGAAVVGECKAILSTTRPEIYLQGQCEHQNQGTIFDALSVSIDEMTEADHCALSRKEDSNAASSSVHEQQESISQDEASMSEHNDRCASSPGSNHRNSETAEASNNAGSLESFQETFNSATNALLQRLRASAETRKREVTRCRYSLERKEQIMMDEKEMRESMPTVEEDMPAPPPRTLSVSMKPKKNVEGLDPYKPFVARPAPSKAAMKSHNPRRSSMSVNDPKPSTKSLVRKKLAPHEDPYTPFKARPMPSTTFQSTPLIGIKRKSSAALRSHPEQNKSSVKPAALSAKPPTRLLSGRDASVAKEQYLKQRIEKENDKAKGESTFKARPMPSSSLITSTRLIGEGLLAASGKENEENSTKTTSSVIRPYVPHSTRRAEQRAEFDGQRAEREKTEKIERFRKRQHIIDKAKTDADRLKDLIR